ncbi:hypothetical protein B296_00021460 [Ensete ventricosum]|uniref:Uncharacterized protein n=1 Tax=Ensete ventricosum TaxID=4639 RepID=A0A427APY5_ENSVE|nr:hypothetical protein B296_00021460 [Ensete ventricosum]
MGYNERPPCTPAERYRGVGRTNPALSFCRLCGGALTEDPTSTSAWPPHPSSRVAPPVPCRLALVPVISDRHSSEPFGNFVSPAPHSGIPVLRLSESGIAPGLPCKGLVGALVSHLPALDTLALVLEPPAKKHVCLRPGFRSVYSPLETPYWKRDPTDRPPHYRMPVSSAIGGSAGSTIRTSAWNFEKAGSLVAWA